MLNTIEKLINEHGSSTILKERLQLAADQYTVLQDKLEASQQKNSALEAENQSLKTQLQQAQEEVNRLQEIMQASTEAQGNKELKEIEQQILGTLFEANTHFSPTQLATKLSIGESLTKYHIDRLIGMKLIGYGPAKMNAPMYYVLSEHGRKYVVEQIRT